VETERRAARDLADLELQLSRRGAQSGAADRIGQSAP